jgi:hypothetical protein
LSGKETGDGREHGLDGSVPIDGVGRPIAVGLHRFEQSEREIPRRERRPLIACLFRILVLISAPVRAAALAAGFRPHFDYPVWLGPSSNGQRQRGSGAALAGLWPSGLSGSRFGRAATTGPHAVMAGLRLLGSIASGFNLAATTRWWRGPVVLRRPGSIGAGFNWRRERGSSRARVDPSPSGRTWLPVRSGGDNEAAVGLGSTLRLPGALGFQFDRAAITRPHTVFVGLRPPGSLRFRLNQAATTRLDTALARVGLPGLFRSGFNLAATGGGWWGPAFGPGHAGGPDPSGGSGCAAW